MEYSDLIEAVERRTGAPDADAARDATVAVLTALSERLDEPGREMLVDALPDALAQQVERDVERDTFPGVAPEPQQLVAEVARRTRHPTERARLYAEQVLGEVAESAPTLTADLHDHLVSGARPLVDLLAPRPVPDGALAGHPRPLTEAELRRQLRRLTDWTGDTRRISRTVALHPDRIEYVRHQVDQAEKELQHRVAVETVPDGVRFTAWTRSIDAVTPMDIELALRVDQAVEQAGT